MNTLEDAIIRKVRRIAARNSGAPQIAVAIGHDAALLAAKLGQQTILTCDWFLEGTHFQRGKHPPDAVGWKCLARALSDVAAIGGKPRCFLLSIAIPQNLTGQWLTEFLQGLRRAAFRFSCPLAGGDTTRRDQVLINVTAIGEVQTGHAVLRSGARRGDAIFVTGRLGEADLGLQLLRSAKRGPRASGALRKHLYPEPRLVLGQWLANHRLATAMMDLSDGLSTDLSRLCLASKVGACVETARIPAVRFPSEARSKRVDPMTLALHGGDDYELLFTVRPNHIERIPSSFRGVRLTRIGQITAGYQLKLLCPDGRERTLAPRGWDPFRTD